MNNCDRRATGNFTRRMFSADDGENWPEDVTERPICLYHHILLESIKAGTAAGLFGLVIAGAAWVTNAETVFYFYATAAVLAGLLLSEVTRRLRKTQLVSND